MKYTLLLILALAMSLTLHAKKIDLKPFEQLDVIKKNGIVLTDAMQVDGLYFLKGIRNGTPLTFFISQNKKVFIPAEGYRLKDMSKITFPIDPKIVKGQEDFSYGSGKKVLYVFTDPECPYCLKFEKKMATLGKKYTFKLFLFPLSFHKNALAMSEWILTGKTDQEKAARLLSTANGGTEYASAKISPEQKKSVEKLLEKNKLLAQKISVMGTPTVFDAKMNIINWNEL